MTLKLSLGLLNMGSFELVYLDLRRNQRRNQRRNILGSRPGPQKPVKSLALAWTMDQTLDEGSRGGMSRSLKNPEPEKRSRARES